jgi:nicotinamide-nucleotide amidase
VSEAGSGASDAELGALASRLGEQLQARGWRVAVAESCTGGWVAKVLTDIAGSSGWFDRGFVTYSNEAKHELLGVLPETLEAHGAVSGEVVEEMVTGALAASHADLAVAISGVAGPGGGTADKPVGTVWLAWGRRGAAPASERVRLEGDREAVRRLAVAHALRRMLRMQG